MKMSELIKKAEAKVGKKMKIPTKVKNDILDMKKLKLIKGTPEEIMLHYYNSMGDDKFDIRKYKNPVFKELVDNIAYNYFHGYDVLFMEANYYAMKIIKGIKDKIVNKEPVDNAYSEVKEWFKNLDIDYTNNRVFNSTVDKVSKWMKQNFKK